MSPNSLGSKQKQKRTNEQINKNINNEYFQNSIVRLSFLCRVADTKTA